MECGAYSSAVVRSYRTGVIFKKQCGEFNWGERKRECLNLSKTLLAEFRTNPRFLFYFWYRIRNLNYEFHCLPPSQHLLTYLFSFIHYSSFDRYFISGNPFQAWQEGNLGKQNKIKRQGQLTLPFCLEVFSCLLQGVIHLD